LSVEIVGKRLRTVFRYVIRYYQKYAIYMKIEFLLLTDINIRLISV
jgi:hypothetical protein